MAYALLKLKEKREEKLELEDATITRCDALICQKDDSVIDALFIPLKAAHCYVGKNIGSKFLESIL